MADNFTKTGVRDDFLGSGQVHFQEKERQSYVFPWDVEIGSEGNRLMMLVGTLRRGD